MLVHLRTKIFYHFYLLLREGEAILTGIDFPMPLSIKIIKPKIEPDSQTPLFSSLPSIN